MSRAFAGGTSSDRVTVTEYAAHSSLDLLTLAVSVKRDGAGSSGFSRAVDWDDNYLIEDNPGSRMRFIARRWTTDGTWHYPMPTDGILHCHIITYDYGLTTNVPVVWVDGVAQTVTLLTAPTGTPTAPTAQNKFCVGNTSQATPGNQAWLGDLAEVAVWNRFLNDLEKINVTNCGPRSVPAGRVLYLEMEGIDDPEPNNDHANTGAVTGTTMAIHPEWFDCVPIKRLIGLSRICDGVVMLPMAGLQGDLVT